MGRDPLADPEGYRGRVELATRSALARIAGTPPAHDAYVAVFGHEALAHAREVDRDGEGELARWPMVVGVKDSIRVRERGASCGVERIVAPPGEDAAVVRALREAGAVIVGQQRSQAYGLGIEWPSIGNVHDPDRYPGGSSTGAGISVALGTATLALGVDTLGSIRKPASLNGVVGYRPTPGRVSTVGVVPVVGQYDVVGWLGPDVDTVRRAESVLVRDDTPAPSPASPLPRRVAVPAHAIDTPDVGVRQAFARSLERLERAGTRVVFRPLDTHELAVGALRDEVADESSSWHRARASRFPEAYPSWVLDSLQRRTVAMPVQRRARAIALGQEELSGLFDQVDLIVTPTVDLPPLTRTDMVGGDGLVRPEVLRRYCRWTSIATLGGLPAVTVPAGSDRRGFPVGVQLIGRSGSDRELLAFAKGVTVCFDDTRDPSEWSPRECDLLT